MNSSPRFLPALALAGIGCLSSVARSQETYWEAYGSGPAGRLGELLDTVPDLDGDGIDDIIAGGPRDDTSGVDAGYVMVFSGADGSVVHTVTGLVAADAFGSAVAGLEDVDGDGLGDFLVGAPLADVNGSRSGTATLFSGADASIIREFHGFTSSVRLGEYVTATGDMDGDSIPDMAVSMAHSTPPAVFVYSGADGSVIHTLVETLGASAFGKWISGVGDVDLDGTPDLLVGRTGMAQVRIFSGATGGVIHDIVIQQFGDSSKQHAFAPLGDVDGDGHADILCSYAEDQSFYGAAGRVQVFSGATGELMHSITGHYANDRFGWSVDGLDDVDGDGAPDFVVGSHLTEALPTLGWASGSVTIVSGATGDVLRTIRQPPSPPTQGSSYEIGYSVTAGDFDGDGHPDVATGIPNFDLAIPGHGAVRVYGTRFLIESISPTATLFHQQTPVTLRGVGFQPSPTPTVLFGATPATDVTWVSPEEITCMAPAGAEDSVVDVTWVQDGHSGTLEDAFEYEGTRILDIFPGIGPVSGGQIVTITATHVAAGPGTEVDFVSGPVSFPANILQITPPDTIVARTPVFPDTLFADVRINGPNGSDVLPSGLTVKDVWLNSYRGNIDGGDVVRAFGSIGAHAPQDIELLVGPTPDGFVPAQVLENPAGSVTFITPPISEGTGLPTGIRVQSAGGGSILMSENSLYTYTPGLKASVAATSLLGGSLDIQLITDPGASRPFVIVWSRLDPAYEELDPTEGVVLPGYSGICYDTPLSFYGLGSHPGLSLGSPGSVTLTPAAPTTGAVKRAGAKSAPGSPAPGPPLSHDGTPAPAAVAPFIVPAPPWPQSIEIPFGPYFPGLVGMELHLQAVVTGEGGPLGSFTNVVSLDLPF